MNAHPLHPNAPYSSQDAPHSSLAQLRNAIDTLDAQLLDLLHQRAALSRNVGDVKRQQNPNDTVIYRPEREQQIVDRLATLSAQRENGLPRDHIAAIWREIFASSRALQKPLSVAFLGPLGTFSHMAAQECLGHSVNLRPHDTFHAVFRAVHDKNADFGMVPLENSLHGSVGQNFDLFADHDVHIVREHYSLITHCLMSREPSLASVRRVYSHPQPLGQCAAWLRAHLTGVPTHAEESTAAAAHKTLEEPGSAAIGHPDLAAMLGLHILASSIEDLPGNTTRFALLAPGPAPVAPLVNSPKTSLLFTVPDKPGALAAILALLQAAGINLSKLESRPMRGTAWQYVFFTDLACNLLAHPDTLAALNAACHSIRILGIYEA